MIAQQQIENKLSEIHKAIINQQKSNDKKDDYSLYIGNTGISLFLANYSRYTNSKNTYGAFEALYEECLDNVCEGIYVPSFCGGISGMLYGIKLLNENEFSNIDISEIHKGYAPYLKKQMFAEIGIGHFDFMHGAIGIAIYFLKNGDSSDFDDCVKLVDKLYNIAIIEKDIVKWKFTNPVTKKNAFNISMSHGMSSIAMFLCRMINLNIDVERCSNLLTKTVNYIMQQEIDYKKYGSYFPSYSIESENGNIMKSRLGWCYGDLGVAMALWKSGCTLNISSWKDKAIEVFEYSAMRRDLQMESVSDADVCHGAAGIAQIFKRIYLETNNSLFEDAHQFWIEQTIKMASFEDGLAGYKHWNGNDDGWCCETSVLEGIAGIGLVLLSSISSDPQYSNWDEILLLH